MLHVRNHRRLVNGLVMTDDIHLTELVRNMIENQRLFVVRDDKKSRWRRQRNGLSQGSWLATMLFNVYTNGQHIHLETRSFIYADDLCLTSEGKNFHNTETTLTSALGITKGYNYA